MYDQAFEITPNWWFCFGSVYDFQNFLDTEPEIKRRWNLERYVLKTTHQLGACSIVKYQLLINFLQNKLYINCRALFLKNSVITNGIALLMINFSEII